MSYKYVLSEKEPGFSTITLNRPEKRNALSLDLNYGRIGKILTCNEIGLTKTKTA